MVKKNEKSRKIVKRKLKATHRKKGQQRMLKGVRPALFNVSSEDAEGYTVDADADVRPDFSLPSKITKKDYIGKIGHKPTWLAAPLTAFELNTNEVPFSWEGNKIIDVNEDYISPSKGTPTQIEVGMQLIEIDGEAVKNSEDLERLTQAGTKLSIKMVKLPDGWKAIYNDETKEHEYALEKENEDEDEDAKENDDEEIKAKGIIINVNTDSLGFEVDFNGARVCNVISQFDIQPTNTDEYAVCGHFEPGMYIVECDGHAVNPDNPEPSMQALSEKHQQISVKAVKLPADYSLAWDMGQVYYLNEQDDSLHTIPPIREKPPSTEGEENEVTIFVDVIFVKTKDKLKIQQINDETFKVYLYKTMTVEHLRNIIEDTQNNYFDKNESELVCTHVALSNEMLPASTTLEDAVGDVNRFEIYGEFIPPDVEVSGNQLMPAYIVCCSIL